LRVRSKVSQRKKSIKLTRNLLCLKERKKG
jgi:hypothetical protein